MEYVTLAGYSLNRALVVKERLIYGSVVLKSAGDTTGKPSYQSDMVEYVCNMIYVK